MQKQVFNLSKVGIVPSPTGRARVGVDCTSSKQSDSPSLEFLSSLSFAKKFFSLHRRDRHAAFTLAEVLITLGIIGVVAAMTLPIVINKINDMQFKIAYKKAYSDLSQVVQRALQEDEMPYRSNQYDTSATTAEWAVIKKYLKVTKECQPAQLASCWANGEKVNINRYPASSNDIKSSSFVDASGRSWAEYSSSENLYLVDTNGMKAPNRFGKDRFIFTFMGQDKSRIQVGIPVGVRPMSSSDKTNIDTGWCPSGGCYYHSWLYK